MASGCWQHYKILFPFHRSANNSDRLNRSRGLPSLWRLRTDDGKPEVTGSNYCRERVNALHPCPEFLVQLGLENYPFLTPCVEIKKANLYGVSTGAILGRFSKAAAVNVTRFTNALRGNQRMISAKPTHYKRAPL